MDEESRLAWDEYYRRRRIWLRLLLGWMLSFAIPGALAVLLQSAVLAGIAGVLIFAIGVAHLFAAGYTKNFDCPRCHKKFFSGKFGYNTFARKCIHCTLPLGGSINEPLPLWWHNPGKFEWPELKDTQSP